MGKLIILPSLALILYGVSVLSQFMQEPRRVHWEGALQVLAYIKGVPRRGLIYRQRDHFRIEAYSDVNYVNGKGDGKSTIHYYTLIICLFNSYFHHN